MIIRIGGLLPLIADAVPSAAIDRAWQLSSHDAPKALYSQGGSRETAHRGRVKRFNRSVVVPMQVSKAAS